MRSCMCIPSKTSNEKTTLPALQSIILKTTGRDLRFTKPHGGQPATLPFLKPVAECQRTGNRHFCTIYGPSKSDGRTGEPQALLRLCSRLPFENVDFSNMIVPASLGIPDQLLNSLMSEMIAARPSVPILSEQPGAQSACTKTGYTDREHQKTISENIAAMRKSTDISLDEMNKRIGKVEAQISRLPKTQRQLGGIERKFRLNDAIYNYLLEKRAEAKITQASNMPDDLIIEPAKMTGTGPVSPIKNELPVCLFPGLAIPFGYLTLKSLVSNKIESNESIERITDAPILGKIMHNSIRQ